MNTHYHLVVVHAFAKYQRGDVITDSEVINEILDKASEKHAFSAFVRRIAAPVQPQVVEEIKVEEAKEEKEEKELNLSSKKTVKSK